jgi:drug/metabolite transporter (DMT)-like permease
MSTSFRSHVPLGLIFISGIGFSIQSLFIKILSESGFSGSFQLLFLRGFCQMLVSSIFVYRNVLRGDRTKLFGNNLASIGLLTMSSLLAYAGQAFVFTSIEYVPVDFALVLDRQSVVFQAVLAYFLLGEPWLLIEIVATVLSIFGVVLIAQPAFFAHLFAAISLFLGVKPEGDDSNSSRDVGGDSSPSENGFGLDENAMTLSDSPDLDRAGVVYGLLAAFLTACAYVTIRMTGPSRGRYASSRPCCSVLVPEDDTTIPCPNVVFAASISQLILSIPCMLLSSKEEFDLSLSYSGWALLIGVAVIGTWSQLALTAGGFLACVLYCVCLVALGYVS